MGNSVLSNPDAPPKPEMLMNHTSFINYGTALRSQPGSQRPLDYGSLDVDKLLVDNSEALKKRRETESLQGYQAKQAANALQKWMSTQNLPLPQDLKLWHRAYDVLAILVSRTDQLPDQLLVQQVIFKTDAPVARGSYGNVFRGVYGRDQKKRETVAVKRLENGKDGETSHRFWREALIWYQLRHPNIVALRGIFLRREGGKPEPCMISPWVDGGTIINFIKSKSSNFNPRRHRLSLLSDVAEGLQYMHQRGLIHGDLHAGNILVHQGRALLTDFGLTVVGDESQSETPPNEVPARGHGAIRWLAPELVTVEIGQTPPKTMAGDMFGFGRLCLAICTNGELFTHISEHTLKSKLKDGWRPSKPELLDCGDHVPMPNGLWRLAEDCWKLESEGRPSATKALERLHPDQIYR